MQTLGGVALFLHGVVALGNFACRSPAVAGSANAVYFPAPCPARPAAATGAPVPNNPLAHAAYHVGATIGTISIYTRDVCMNRVSSGARLVAISGAR